MNTKTALLSLTLIGSIAAGTGCKNNGTHEEAKKTDSTITQKANNVRDMGLTMPILDALFFEEGFEDELKTKLNFTPAEIQKLKSAARASVADLTEDGTDYLSSARSVARSSDQKIRSILGDQKAMRLYTLAAQRYANGDVDGLFPTQPNSVPKDTRIVVNTPAFRMDVFQDGRLLKTYRIGIGYPEFPLPVGMRRAETIIFNPTWTPPDEPWVKGNVQAGKKVAAGDKLNPLGPIKIPIGSPSLIHGGKAVAKLGNFASHGCVGLTNAQVQDVAVTIAQVAGNSLTADSVTGFGRQKTKTKTVKLNKPLPVELRYETIVAENGALHIYRDVYEQGTNTLQNAREVLAVYGIKYEALSEAEKQTLIQALTDMNTDAHGDPIAIGDTNADKEARAKKGQVTRGVKGEKEMIVNIAALQGKGYPAPANYNTGG